MAGSGITRKVDALGRVVLPVEVRRSLGIEVGDLIDVSVEDRRLVLRKVDGECTFCGSVESLREYADRLVCAECIVRLGSARPAG